MDSRIRSNKGFTLTELLVVLAILTLLVAAAEPTYRTFLVQTETKDAATVYVQTLRRASSLAQAGSGDSTWGVMVATNAITLFKGATYASRDSRYDERYTPNIPITIAGLTEISFTPLSGIPNVIGTTTISSGTQSITITTNEKGIITY